MRKKKLIKSFTIDEKTCEAIQVVAIQRFEGNQSATVRWLLRQALWFSGGISARKWSGLPKLDQAIVDPQELLP